MRRSWSSASPPTPHATFSFPTPILSILRYYHTLAPCLHAHATRAESQIGAQPLECIRAVSGSRTSCFVPASFLETNQVQDVLPPSQSPRGACLTENPLSLKHRTRLDRQHCFRWFLSIFPFPSSPSFQSVSFWSFLLSFRRYTAVIDITIVLCRIRSWPLRFQQTSTRRCWQLFLRCFHRMGWPRTSLTLIHVGQSSPSLVRFWSRLWWFLCSSESTQRRASIGRRTGTIVCHPLSFSFWLHANLVVVTCVLATVGLKSQNVFEVLMSSIIAWRNCIFCHLGLQYELQKSVKSWDGWFFGL